MRGGVLHRGLGPLPVPTDLDWQPALQAQLDAALAAGKKLFTLPAGVSYYGSAIVIPKGTSDLTIQGAPDGSTVLRALSGFPEGHALIEIARDDNDGNEVFDLEIEATRSYLNSVQRGQTALTLRDSDPGEDLEAGKWYVLSDQDEVPEWTGSSWTTIKYRAEMVKCIAWDSENKIATLEVALERDYDVTPNVLHLQFDDEDRKCLNIALKDFTANGQYGGDEENPELIGYGIWSLFTHGLSVQNVRSEMFTADHVRCDFCRDISMHEVSVSNTPHVESTGDDPTQRGVSTFWCTGITLLDITASSLRHGIEFSQGNQDFLLDGYVCTASKDASLDLHGARNRYGRLRNFDIDERLKIGNLSYPAGDQGIVVENGVVDKAVEIQGGSGDIRMTNVSAQYLQQTCIRDYPDFYPHDCEYLSCTFTNIDNSGSNHCFTCDMYDPLSTGTLIRRFTNQVFKWCTFVQLETDDPSWCIYLGGLTDDSDATFVECLFSQEDERELIKNEVQVEGSELVLAYDTCTFDSQSEQNVRYAFLFEEDSFGQCSIANSTFFTDFDEEQPAFADNRSGAFNVLEAGNSIEPH